MTDPQGFPVSGEQHERAVKAAARVIADRALFVTRFTVTAAAAIDAYHASLREQGVVLEARGTACFVCGAVRCGNDREQGVILVDLREVITALRKLRGDTVRRIGRASSECVARLVERRFGRQRKERVR